MDALQDCDASECRRSTGPTENSRVVAGRAIDAGGSRTPGAGVLQSGKIRIVAGRANACGGRDGDGEIARVYVQIQVKEHPRDFLLQGSLNGALNQLARFCSWVFGRLVGTRFFAGRNRQTVPGIDGSYGQGQIR